MEGGVSGMPSDPKRLSTRPRMLLRSATARTLTVGLLALAWGASTEGGVVVSTVTNGVGASQNPFDKNSQRKIVRDWNGVCYLVYTQTRPDNGNREVRITRLTNCTTSGGSSFALFTSAIAGVEYLYPSIDIGDDRTTFHVVALATNTGVATGIPHTRNANFANWNVADSWTGADGISHTGGGTVESDTISTTIVGAPTVAVDPLGHPHVVYVAADTGRPNVFHTYYNAGWSTPLNLSGIMGTGTLPQDLDPSIDVANGNVHVLYMDDSFPNDARRDPIATATCGSTAVVSRASRGRQQSSTSRPRRLGREASRPTGPRSGWWVAEAVWGTPGRTTPRTKV